MTTPFSHEHPMAIYICMYICGRYLCSITTILHCNQAVEKHHMLTVSTSRENKPNPIAKPRDWADTGCVETAKWFPVWK